MFHLPQMVGHVIKELDIMWPYLNLPITTDSPKQTTTHHFILITINTTNFLKTL